MFGCITDLKYNRIKVCQKFSAKIKLQIGSKHTNILHTDYEFARSSWVVQM